MILKSYSKINLSLRVNKKLKNGLHDIQSHYSLINLFDLISIKRTQGKKDIVKFKGKFAKFIKKKENSIVETLTILRDQKLITKHYLVRINKKIPVFGGLGGGSSNAAFLIKYLVKKKITKNLLNILSKKIGTDLKLFLLKQGFLKSLKIISNSKKKYKLYFLLVYPNIKCSTKYVYSKVRKYHSKSNYSLSQIDNKQNFIRLLVSLNNDLQSIVEKKYPIIKKLLKEYSNYE